MVGLLAGCAVAQVDQPDLAAIPTGEPRVPSGMAPVGPISIVGRGVAFERGWRYVVWRSADGTCTQLELVDVAAAACGDVEPAEGEVFGGVGSGASLNGAIAADGLVSDAVGAVTLRTSSGEVYPATLMPLEAAGLRGQAFVGFVPPDERIESISAFDGEGRLLDTYDPP